MVFPVPVNEEIHTDNRTEQFISSTVKFILHYVTATT